jgi:hypothetical protein
MDNRSENLSHLSHFRPKTLCTLHCSLQITAFLRHLPGRSLQDTISGAELFNRCLVAVSSPKRNGDSVQILPFLRRIQPRWIRLLFRSNYGVQATDTTGCPRPCMT